MKKSILILLIMLLPLVFITGCDVIGNIFSTPTPVPTDIPVPTVVPTSSPTPTPEPTPTPYVASYYDKTEWNNLFMDQEKLEIRTPAHNRVILYENPDCSVETEPIKNKTTARITDIVILNTVTGEDGQDYYHVQTSFSSDTGYIPVANTVDSDFYDETYTGAYAIMKRPGSYIFYTSNIEDKVNAQENYHAVRILGTKMAPKDTLFYYVVTQDGNFGYMQPEQLTLVTREQMEQYLNYGTVTGCQEEFSLDYFCSCVESLIGNNVDSMDEFIYSQLENAGLFFSPGYYRYLEKPLGNTEFYPDGLYQDKVYNSRLFKLWNSAGNLVSCSQSNEMQWDYIDNYSDVARGDLLFFSSYSSSDTPIEKDVRVVFKGKYSGFITDCGVSLGDDKVVLCENGKVSLIENFSSSSKFQYFDSARRINIDVTDLKSHLWECIICSMYDRLGTPYNNFDRLGDASYDCSGIICWSMRSLGVHRIKSTFKYLMPETTASGWATTRLIYLADGTKCNMELLDYHTGNIEDLDNLERGDLVFLYSPTTHKVGHVMVYLGNNTVIHSTTINEQYRGTLVAEIRQELKDLYYGSNRITEIED